MVKERLKQLRKSLKLTQGEFGKKIGMSDVAISYMESGRTSMSKQNIRLICLTFGVNEEWLENGTGEMIDTAAALTDYQKRLLDLFYRLSPTAQKMLIEYAEKLVKDEEALRAPEKQATGSATSALDEPDREKRNIG
jgi:transcriptional regulator with XRE-family HTH domain